MSHKKKLVLKKKNCIILSIIFLIIIFSCFLFNVLDNSDGKKLKIEYQALNGKKNDYGEKYLKIKIAKSKKVKYIDIDELLDFMKEETGLIFIGSAHDNDSRKVMNTFIDTVDKSCLDNLYYLNIDKFESKFEITDSKLQKTKEAEPVYYELLNLLDNYLENKIIQDEYGFIYEANEKGFNGPIVLALSSGQIVRVHSGSIALSPDKEENSLLNKEETQELKVVYNSLIEEITKNGFCEN